MNRQTDNDWQRLREIFDATLAAPIEERAVFARRMCSDDPHLLAEIESLLESYESSEEFLETPAAVQVAENDLAVEQRLTPGQMLGDYEITELIGTGGMGEVYLARDTKLGRAVAIKLLRASFRPDDSSNQRLLREARAAALLEHPHICHIYQVGETSNQAFIVMQHIVGMTLAELLAAGLPPAKESIGLAIQIAEGLGEAHSKGMIHRDIKPANVIVNERGQVKILDFGLAKLIESENSIQTAQRMNSSGAMMGTVPFMSPEQLRGKALDARSDIFSFGALLFEMLSGRPAFARDNNAETISAILNDEPDWSALPSSVREIVRKCMEKDPRRRYASIDSVASDLRAARAIEDDVDRRSATNTSAERMLATGEPTAEKPSAYSWQRSDDGSVRSPEGRSTPGTTGGAMPNLFRSPNSVFVILGVVVVAGIIAFVYWQTTARRSTTGNFDSLRPVRLVQWRSGASSNDTDYRVSHDGKLVAYSSSKHGSDEVIYVKQTGDGEEIIVTKDEWRNVSPIWSPDDQRIAYVSIRAEQPGIYVSPSLGGNSTPLKFMETNVALRHWSRDGRAIFYEQSGNLYRLEIANGATEQITRLPESKRGNDRYFSFSPDEKRIAYCDTSDEQRDVWVMPIDGGDPIQLTNDPMNESRPLWHPDGNRLLYNVDRNGFAQIDVGYLDGNPAVQLTRGEGSYELIDLSPDGSRIYYTNWEKRSDISRIDVETGEESEQAAGIEAEMWPDVSPDGSTIAYQMNATPNPTGKLSESVVMITRSGDPPRQVVRNGFNPRWTRDSRRLAFLRWNGTERRNDLWLVDTITGAEHQLRTEGVRPPSYAVMPISRTDVREFDFSADGRFVYLDAQRPKNVQVGSIDGGDSRNLTNNRDPEERFFSPMFSPDANSVAFVAMNLSEEEPHAQRIMIYVGGRLQEIFSTTDRVRLVGWLASGSELLIETTPGPMKSGPLDIDLIRISLAGRRETIASLEAVHADTVTLSPDGRTLSFVARRNGKDDIWTLALDSRETRKVSNNGNTRVFFANLAWSSDGKTIYFDKQEQVNTISMFENFN